MSYKVKEIFYSLQGEGAHSGRPAIFCRFSNCNLWSGKEEERANAVCKFCDTDFVGGDEYTLDGLVQAIAAKWPGGGKPYVICTGGEPLLQVDIPLVDALHVAGFEVAVETNGTVGKNDVAAKLDWVCVSPKADARVKLDRGHELKLVYPQVENHPSDFERMGFKHFFLQPCDGVEGSMKIAIDYCLAHPHWSLSLQTHKIGGFE